MSMINMPYIVYSEKLHHNLGVSLGLLSLGNLLNNNNRNNNAGNYIPLPIPVPVCIDKNYIQTLIVNSFVIIGSNANPSSIPLSTSTSTTDHNSNTSSTKNCKKLNEKSIDFKT